MDRFVADPGWGHWIVAYFYLGGIAAGAFAASSLIRLFGVDDDRRLARIGDLMATPLVALCGAFLVVDLGRPERFWHMLIQSETFRPMFKWWSPMSSGSWGLSAFGAFAGLAFASAVADRGWLGPGRSRGILGVFERGPVGKVVAAGGLLSALYLGSYTGSLLTATNQPGWARSTWLSPLFLASSMSTGAAALGLAGMFTRADEHAIRRVDTLDGLSALLELAMLAAFASSFDRREWVGIFSTMPGALIPAFVVPVGLVVPLILRRSHGRRAQVAAGLLILAGGLALRYAVVALPGPILAAAHTHRGIQS